MQWSVVRIALALAVIFTLGVLVGRLTTPAVETSEGVASGDNQLIGRTGKRVMRRYHEQLEFTPEQSENLREMFITVSRRMEVLPRRSRARLAALEDFHEELAPHLTEPQRKIADEILEGARSLERVR